MKNLLVGLTLLAYMTTAVALTVTVCNCDSATSVRVLSFQDAKCNTSKLNETPTFANYTIYTEQRGATRFPGFVCSRWNNIKIVKRDVFNQEWVIPRTVALDTTPEDCKAMSQRKECEGAPMKYRDRVWSYKEDPPTEGAWFDTKFNVKVNCAVEEVTLYQEEEDTAFETLLGVADPNKGFLSHNHMTLIWDATVTSVVEHKLRLLVVGTARIVTGEKPGTFRIMDERKQIDFHIKKNERCVPSTTMCTLKDNVYDIISEPNLIAHVLAYNSRSVQKLLEHDLQELLGNRSQVPEQLTGAHVQYIRDKLTENENNMVDLITQVQCDVEWNHQVQALIAAQYNGWLAADILGLPNCSKIIAFGRTALVQKCESVKADFRAEVTKCGPQPKYKNYTINTDGWELIPFSQCYWANGLVNFNGKPYRYQDKEWTAAPAEVITAERKPGHTFKFEDEDLLTYEHRNNPAYMHSLSSQMGVVSEILSAMNEHATLDTAGKPINNIIYSPDVRGKIMETVTHVDYI